MIESERLSLSVEVLAEHSLRVTVILLGKESLPIFWGRFSLHLSQVLLVLLLAFDCYHIYSYNLQ